jgi:competence/damage-inducible protein CinA-like protein
MKIEIITTGDELMSGLTLDTNFRWAAERLSTMGFDLTFHTSVGDDEEDLKKAFGYAENRAQAIIVSGGLGPTPDDLSAGVASIYFGVGLELNRLALEMLEKNFRERGRQLSEINRKQAYLPRGSKILENFWGTAPGFQYERPGSVFFFLPGVPKEFRAMIDKYVIPELNSRSIDRPHVRTMLVKTFGLRESEVAEKLQGLGRDGIYIGYRSHFPEVHLRISAHADRDDVAQDLLDWFEGEVSKRIGDYIFSTKGEDLEQVVGELLSRERLTLAIAESCTGGLLAHRITNVPGSSGYFESGVVSYSNESKVDVLGVDDTLIESKGAVSAEVVQSMAEGVRKLANTDLGVGISGIAGPTGGSSEKPVGTVFIGISCKNKGTFSQRYQFRGLREEIKIISSEAALDLIRKFILNGV